jgi:pimeloyl-ACP methyl ester carboxylesterase
MKRPFNLAEPLYVTESGVDGSTLVFLPGMGGTTRYWQGRLTALEKQHHVLLVDSLGFGQSPKPPTQYTVERHLDALHQTLSPYAPFTLIGHSMGAVLSVAYAAHYPEQVDRLILIGLPYFGGREETYEHFRNGPVLNRWFFTNVTMAAIACMTTRRLFGGLLPYLLRDIPREVAEDLVKHTWRSFTSSLWEVVYNYDLLKTVEQLDPLLPVFCLHGEQDQTAPLAGVQQLAEKRPNWHVEVLTGIDHHPWLRQPDICSTLVETFLVKNEQ